MSAIRGRFRVQWPAFTLDAAFEAPARGVTALFGPSGSGKTTLLRCIAGLEHARGGHLSVDGETWQDGGAGRFVPTHRRPLGYVFQEASLFPHLSVRRNLEYGWRRTPPAARRVPFDHAVGLLGLEGLLERDPARLSGGERQRAAIARALLAGPRLLLMDEPLANLDAAAKAEILPYLQRVRDALSIPMLYVSHALDEVLALADHMLLLRAGRVAAAGPLAEVLAGAEFAALRDPELGSVLPATVLDHDEAYHLTRLRTAGGDLRVPRLDLTAGAHARVRILARDVSLALEPPAHTSILNTLAARVLSLTPHGPAQALVRLDVGGAPMLALVTRYSADRLKLAPGMAVHAQVKTVALLAGEGVLPAAGG